MSTDPEDDFASSAKRGYDRKKAFQAAKNRPMDPGLKWPWRLSRWVGLALIWLGAVKTADGYAESSS